MDGLMGILGIGFLLGIILMVVLRRFALRRKVLLSGEVALVGGIGVAVVVAVCSLGIGTMLQGDLKRIAIVVGAALLMLIFGVIDDLKEQRVVEKLFFQAICATILIAFDIRTHIVYVGYWGNVAITFLWVVGVTNAFNLLDIVDGLSAGVAFIAAAAFLIVSWVHPNVDVQIVAMSLCVALAGFWIFNFPPARIYLGNAGSHFLGFIMAALAMMVSYASVDRPLALVSPIIMLWLPLLETAVLVYFRMAKGISPFYKSNDHIALKLVKAGLSRKAALFLMLGLAGFFSLAGIVVSMASTPLAVSVLGVVVLASWSVFLLLKRMNPYVE